MPRSLSLALLLLSVGLAVTMVALCAAPARATTLIVKIEPFGKTVDQAMLAPRLVDLEGNDRVSGRRIELAHGSEWVFEIDMRGRIARKLRLDIDRPIPGMRYAPLTLFVPFYHSDARIEITLAPVVPRADARTVSDLYATSLTNKSLRFKHQTHQRAVHAAKARIERVGNRWARLSDYDVQAVFKHLESLLKLSEQTVVIGNDGTTASRDWMSEAIARNPDRVRAAIGQTNMLTIVSEIDAIEGRRFRRIWQEISERDCEAKVPLYSAYERLYRSLPNQRKKKVFDIVQVQLEEAEAGRASCVADLVRNANMPDGQKMLMLARQIASTERTLQRMRESDLRTRLAADLKFLWTLWKDNGYPGERYNDFRNDT